ncbi:MAG: UDP-2,3-diacylglucosamine diphosphatase [Candidatus Moranbacteria bacterium]|nr:UDP-2,3-diacylglucosamine diphosphatase [Candidatus Moranbacteria bacterium]
MKKNKKKTDILIISDLHLGSQVSRSKEAVNLLKAYNFKKLILLGDIFDSLDFRDLKQKHWDFISYISKRSQKNKVIWVEGNHDKNLSKIMGLLVGVKVYKRYKWKYKGKIYLAMHGHQFDRFLVNNFLISQLASLVYLWIQKIEGKEQRISRFIKKHSKQWLRLSEKVANSAVLYARFYRASCIFCAHTHKAMHVYKHKVDYYNSGCWTDIPSKYITVRKDKIKINDYF